MDEDFVKSQESCMKNQTQSNTLEEMEKFLEMNSLSRWDQDDMESQRRPMTDTESVTHSQAKANSPVRVQC